MLRISTLLLLLTGFGLTGNALAQELKLISEYRVEHGSCQDGSVRADGRYVKYCDWTLLNADDLSRYSADGNSFEILPHWNVPGASRVKFFLSTRNAAGAFASQPFNSFLSFSSYYLRIQTGEDVPGEGRSLHARFELEMPAGDQTIHDLHIELYLKAGGIPAKTSPDFVGNCSFPTGTVWETAECNTNFNPGSSPKYFKHAKRSLCSNGLHTYLEQTRTEISAFQCRELNRNNNELR